jgi:membrane protein
MMQARAILPLLKKTIVSWSDDNATSRSASLSYYTVFSLAPLLLIAVSIAGAVFGKDAVNGELQGQLEGLVGAAGAKAIQDMMASASKPGAGVLASIIGIVLLVAGSLGAFVELQDTLNAIWKVEKDKTSGVKGFLRARAVSFAMVGVIAFFLLASLAASTAIAALGHVTFEKLPGGETVIQVANTLLSFFIVTALFASIFKVLPDTKVPWKDVWLGGAVTAFLFSIGKLLIGLYLGKTAAASSYGAAGSFAVLLIWINYSAMILFFGAEFTHAYSEMKRAPKKLARSPAPSGGSARIAR